jgi:RNA recognition motif-containing protein
MTHAHEQIGIEEEKTTFAAHTPAVECSATAHIKQQATLFVGDLSILVHVKTLHELFAPFGEVLKVELKQIRDSSKPFANFAFVEFALRSDANHAKSATDGTLFFGRMLR